MYLKKKLGKSNDNPSIRIYVNKTENKITFKIEKRALSSTFNSWNDEITWKH